MKSFLLVGTWLTISLLTISLLGCTEVPPAIPTIAPTLFPTLEPSPTPLLDTGWQTLAPGLERRWHNVLNDGILINQLYILRIDPAQYRFDVAYRPGEPLPLSIWLEQTGAEIVVNGSFFTPEWTATGLTIVDGVTSGWSYEFGGMVDIRDGTLRVRPLAQEPYQTGEPIDDGLQTFPILARNGFGYRDDNLDRSRRTVIAQDTAGHIILLVADMSQFTLTELSEWLLQSDLDIVVALNLDGGTSSGLLTTRPNEGVHALVTVPTVITVHRR